MRWCVPLILMSCAALPAQISPGSVGLLWTGSSGTTAGVFGCGPSPFSCVVTVAPVLAGEQVTLSVRGQLGGSYILALSLGGLPCTTVPGIVNQLLIAPTGVVVTVPGFMNTPDGPLACPGGVGQLSFAWPAGLQGLQLHLQGVATGPAGQPAFTNAIRITPVWQSW